MGAVYNEEQNQSGRLQGLVANTDKRLVSFFVSQKLSPGW